MTSYKAAVRGPKACDVLKFHYGKDSALQRVQGWRRQQRIFGILRVKGETGPNGGGPKERESMKMVGGIMGLGQGSG